MNKLTIRKKIAILAVCIVIEMVGFCMLIFIANVHHTDRDIYNRARVLLNDSIYKANNADFSELVNYTYSILDLSGKVIASNEANMQVGDKVDLSALSGASNGENFSGSLMYSAPFIKNTMQAGTIYVSVPYNLINERPLYIYVAMAVLVGGMSICLLKMIKIIFEDIIKPVNEIHKITNRIREGHIEDRLYYDYDGEIGTLCHDFEALRSELEFSFENEKKLKEKEKLLLAYISHDLRTPIATISGYVEGIHNDIVTGDRVHEYTAIILNKISMLNMLIDDILEHSKAQLHEFEIRKHECYSKEYFEKIMKEAKQDIEKKGLRFTYDQIPDVLINIDEKRIRQVMQNLLGNAMKFTNQGEISVSYKVENHNLLVAVKDTGIGIAATDIPMVFDDFYRGEKARTLNVQGSGLGLSISKYIVEQHGGRIECDSIRDHWTVVEFSIPV